MRGTGYAIAEIIWWLLIAVLIGFAVGWLLRRWFLDRQRGDEIAALKAEEEKKRAHLQLQLGDWKSKAEACAADRQRSGADLDRIKLQVDERDGKIAALEGDITTARHDVMKLEAKVEDRESTIAALRSAADKEDPQVAELRRDLEAADGTIGTLRKDTEGYKNTIEALRADLDTERRKQADLESKLGAATSEAETATASLANARSSADELKARIAELEAGAAGSDDLEARVTALQAGLNASHEEKDSLADKLAALEAEHAECGKVEVPPEPAPVPTATPLVELPDKDVAVAKVAEIATRTRGSGPIVNDDLKKVHGVGPKLENLLKSLDITSFRQVANFTTDDIAYVTAALDAFPGRIERDDWMSSAAEEHAKKYNEPA